MSIIDEKMIKNPVKKFKNQQKQTKENKNKIYKKSKKKLFEEQLLITLKCN